MRDREAIDSELRRITLVRRSTREQGHQPPCRLVDELLDERLALHTKASKTEAMDSSATEIVADTWSQCDDIGDITRFGRMGALRRFGSLSMLPLSAATTAALLLVAFEVNHQYPATPPPTAAPPSAEPSIPATQPAAIPPAEPSIPVAQPTAIPPPAEPPIPATQPTAIRPSTKPFTPAAPKATAPPLDIADSPFIDGFNHYGAASPDEMQQAIQNALSGLQAIPGLLAITGPEAIPGPPGVLFPQGIPGPPDAPLPPSPPSPPDIAGPQ